MIRRGRWMWFFLPPMVLGVYLVLTIFGHRLIGKWPNGPQKTRVGLSTVSPDKGYTARIIEIDGHPLDRTFRIELVGTTNRSIFTIYENGDHAGTADRFIWSKDGMHLLFVGAYGQLTGPKFSSGQSAYLLYDISPARLRCNFEFDNHQRFDGADINAIDWDWQNIPLVIAGAAKSTTKPAGLLPLGP